MKQVELAVRARLDELMRPAGLTALQYTALTVLERHPDLTSAHLARHSFVTAQTMADMVTALHDRGLIERCRDLVDRRRLVLTLTPKGRGLLDTYRPAVAGLEDEMLSGLSSDDVARLREMTLFLPRGPARPSSRPAHDLALPDHYLAENDQIS